MKISDFGTAGNTLKADEIPAGRTLRLKIHGFEVQAFENEDGTKDEKCVIMFVDKDKGIATGVQNLREIGRVYGEDMDTWVGKELEVSTAIKGNDKLGFVLRGVVAGDAAGSDDIPF